MRSGTRPLEGTYKKSLKRRLEEIPNSKWIIMEAGSVRGHADIIGHICGYHVELEVKRCEEEATHQTDRTVLQRYNLQKTIDAGSYASFIFPENEIQIMEVLLHLATKKKVNKSIVNLYSFL